MEKTKKDETSVEVKNKESGGMNSGWLYIIMLLDIISATLCLQMRPNTNPLWRMDAF